jgi:multiple sugar transport system substrate-binding protein
MKERECAMKKVLSLFLAIFMIVAVFAGCDGSETTAAPTDGTTTKGSEGTTTATTTKAPPAEAEEVWFFSSVGAYQKILEDEVANWNDTVGAEKGVFIFMETNIDNYTTAFDTMIQSGTYPDIADMYARANYLEAGYFTDLYELAKDYPEVQTTIDRWEPFFAQGVSLRGDKLVCMPLEYVPIKMVYNKEIFDECGITEAPQSWEDIYDYAKIITEKGAGDYYGFAWTSMWTATFRRFVCKAGVASLGRGQFDNNTATYDFSPYKETVELIGRMYQEGMMFPTPFDQHIDPIRQRFSEGLVGMEIAPAYDYSVYTKQFVADFEWVVCDVPALVGYEREFKGASLNRGNISITSWVEEDLLPATVEAWLFLNSDGLYETLFENSAIIPQDPAIAAKVLAESDVEFDPNWILMSDVKNYTAEPPRPESLLTLEGDPYETFFTNVMTGDINWDDGIEDLNKRYNDAYAQAKADGLINTDIYETTYNPGPWE